MGSPERRQAASDAAANPSRSDARARPTADARVRAKASVVLPARTSSLDLRPTGQLPVWPLLLWSRAVLARTVRGLDAGEDEVDAGEELLAVVVFAQLRPGFVHVWVFGWVGLLPLRGDGCEES